MKIIYKTATGVSIIHPTGELTIEEVAAKDVPEGVAFRIVEDAEVPSDRMFRNAWVDNNGITVDIPKAKEITHNARRIARAAELAPLDIQATIPSGATAAEDSRALIRTKYSSMQIDIDAAVNSAALKNIMLQITGA